MVNDIDNKIYSFSSANVFPMKILLNPKLINSCRLDGTIIPIHLQLNPTNKCNFKCEFCSCSDRDKNMELNIEEIAYIFKNMSEHGCESVTITGGGESLLHKNINEIINIAKNLYRIEVGIVSNGTLFNRLNDNSFDNIKWIRISVSDSYLSQINNGFEYHLLNLHNIVNKHNNIDWSFSYVLGEKPNIELIKRIIMFGNKNNFTHIRIVNDIFNADKLLWQMDYVRKSMLLDSKINDFIVNYQDRSLWSKGYNPCYISLLKPVIGADGYIYPCCGTQYALKNPSRDYEKLMRMGKINDLEDIFENQRYFDGSMCYKCYYGKYNIALGVLINGLKHHKFI